MTAPILDDIMCTLTKACTAAAAAGVDPRSQQWPYAVLCELSAGSSELPLIAEPEKLRRTLECAAILDPRLFHVLFLHHCMTIANAMDQGASRADLALLGSGRWIGAPLMTELGRGNSSADIRTTAVYDPSSRDFVLDTPDADAAKHPASVGLGGLCRIGLVSAALVVDGARRGTSLFLVPLRDEHGPRPGVIIEPHATTPLLDLDFATVRFKRVRVPYSRWLRDGAYVDPDGSWHDPIGDASARSRRSTSISRFAWGAVATALAAAARSSVGWALSRAYERQTVDRLAGQTAAITHLTTQRLLFGALAKAMVATALAPRVADTSWQLLPSERGGSTPAPSEMLACALAKVAISELADDAITRCRSSAGAAGFFPENRVMAYQGLSMAFQHASGDNRLILLDAAWSIASNPDRPTRADQPEWRWAGVFRARETLLQAELCAALRPAAPGPTEFELWNANSELALRTAKAHLVRRTLETAFDAWPEHSWSEDARAVVADLFELACLEHIEEDSGSFLALGLQTPAQARAVPQQINAICRRLVGRHDTIIELLDLPAGSAPVPSGAVSFGAVSFGAAPGLDGRQPAPVGPR